MQTYDLDLGQLEADNRYFRVKKNQLEQIQHLFYRFGCEQIHTNLFEPYELYTNVQGTIPLNNMVKVIDPSGKVLVLRPDATIPVTNKVAKQAPLNAAHLRYFYITDIFRQSIDHKEIKGRTQAGVEYFGKKTAAIDAEVIALAMNALQDMQTTQVIMEIGHANFFRQLLAELSLSSTALEQLKVMIQSKNAAEIAPFLKSHGVAPHLIEKISQIPFLYGEPETVLNRAAGILLNETMRQELDRLWQVYSILENYTFSGQIVFDLGLINHMNYYSDIIFQGFTDQVAKPVLMGGRYDRLAASFGKHLPAVGFSIDIESLLEMENTGSAAQLPVDVTIFYDKNSLANTLELAGRLRESGWRIITTEYEELVSFRSNQAIQLTNSTIKWMSGENAKVFDSIADVENFLTTNAQTKGEEVLRNG